MKLRVRIFKV